MKQGRLAVVTGASRGIGFETCRQLGCKGVGLALAAREVEDSPDTLIWLATLPADGPDGGYFRDRQPLPW